MPKTAINKNRQLFRSKHHVRLAGQISSMPLKVNAPLLKQLEDLQFRAGVVPSNAGH